MLLGLVEQFVFIALDVIPLGDHMTKERYF